MPFFIAAATAFLFSFSLITHPGTLLKAAGTHAKTDVRVSAETSTDTTVGQKNTTGSETRKEGNEKTTATETSNTTGDLKSQDDNTGTDGKENSETEDHIKVSALNNRSGKIIPALIPEVAVDHSGSLAVNGNVTLGGRGKN